MNTIKRKEITNNLLFVLLITMSLMLLSSQNVYATEENNPDVSYEVRPVFNSYQTDRGLSYFSYKTKPNENKEVTIEIDNHAQSEETFQIDLNRATTNKNGLIDYSPSKKKASPTLQVDFNNLVNPRTQEIKIGPKSNKRVTFKLRMPNRSYEGIILGGIYVSKLNSNEPSNNAKKNSVQLKQKLSYAIAVVLQQNFPYQEKNNLNLDRVLATTMDNQAVLALDMENPKPNILNHVKTEVTIFKENEKSPLSVLNKKNLSFAPSSIFTLNIPWNQDKIKSGNYLAKITVTSGKDKWNFNKKFTITKENQQNIIKTGDPLKIPKDTPIMMYILTGIGSLIIILLVILLRKRK